jgi:exopolysaccharide production protein ExoZ
MIHNIQAMRGVASLLVFCIHVLVTSPNMGVDSLAWYYYPIGSSGVDIFFVISGFIITLVAPKSTAESNSAVHFAVRRIIRIYPIYWVVLFIAMVASSVIFLSPPLDHRPLWMKIFLTTTRNDKILAAWSLAFEIYFYSVVTILLIFFRKHIIRAIICWCIIMLPLIYYGVTIHPSWSWAIPFDWFIPFDPIILEFMLGVLVATLFRNDYLPLGVTAVVVGVAGLLMGGEAIRHYEMQVLPSWWRIACFGIPAALLIYGLVAVERRRCWVMHPLWQKLGDASYSLYICHQLVLFSLLAIWQHTGLIRHIRGPVSLVIWALIAFTIGVSAHYYIEVPLARWLSRRIGIRRSRVLQVAA